MGLMGGGGAVLTVPLLTYILKIPPVTATLYSLFLVGIGSLFAVFYYHKRKLVQYKTGLLLCLPAMLGVYLSRQIILKQIPEQINFNDKLYITKGSFLLCFFAFIMLFSSYSMIKGQKTSISNDYTDKEVNKLKISLQGFLVGLITGLVGAGGGFMIIPILVISIKLAMKEAVATSLFIITINSIFGFISDIFYNNNIDWNILITLAFFNVLGVISGTSLSKNISGEKLKPAFGVFIMIMGIFILLKELF